MAYDVRAPIIETSTAKGEIAHFFDGSTQLRGLTTHSARVWAHVPYIAKFQLLSGVALQREGAGGVLSCRIKEMAVLETSHVNACAY